MGEAAGALAPHRRRAAARRGLAARRAGRPGVPGTFRVLSGCARTSTPSRCSGASASPTRMVERAAPAAEQRLSVLLGDDALARAHHTSRHNRVVRAWVEAKAAVHGAAQTRATADAPAYSYPSVPDFVTEFAAQAGVHLTGEVKVYNPIRADMTEKIRELRRGRGVSA